MTSQLPGRPNLEQLRKQAKTLLQSAKSGETDAIVRIQALPAFVSKPAAEVIAEVALHDAQSAIAREHGFVSWNALREHVEDASLSFDAAVDEFIRCATGSSSARAMRLLARHPAIAHANLQTELVMGDAQSVAVRIGRQPALATTSGGIQQWEPLLYVCHTCLAREDSSMQTGLVATARLLLEHGANPDAEYHWQWHPELPRTALWGALCEVAHLPLAEALLEAGANPTDGVSLHINAGGGNLDILEFLFRNGANVNGIPGGLPPLVYILGWARTPEGPRWLLEHGADPNLPWRETGEYPIHVAARRWDVAMVELLVSHGADVSLRQADGHTAHTVAELSGNPETAQWLLSHGAADELTPFERFVSACARGDRAEAERHLQREPDMRAKLRSIHHLMLQRAAESGDVPALETMLACGFDPAVADKDGVTPLHRAAMAANAGAVRALLDGGAPVAALDGMFSGTPLLWAAEGWRHESRSDGDHVATARLLIAAGSPLSWDPPPNTPGPERVLDKLAGLIRAASSPVGQG